MATRLFGKLVRSVSSHRAVETFASHSPLAAGLVHRFVAGETLDQAAVVVQSLNSRGFKATLDHLGENVANAEQAHDATAMALEVLRRIQDAKLDAYLSVKLTQLGLDVGEHLVLENANRLLDCAAAAGTFIRLDMEGSSYAARILEIFECLRRDHVSLGTVLQAYLYRSMDDARRLAASGAAIRLVKGAYDEPAHIAFRRKRDTDRNYVRIMEYLLGQGVALAVATHDPAVLGHACEFARIHDVAPSRFEFQMLYGVRRDLQESLVRKGYTVRVYVPFGSQWYPYMTRRLAERPANLLSVGGSIVREWRQVQCQHQY